MRCVHVPQVAAELRWPTRPFGVLGQPVWWRAPRSCSPHPTRQGEERASDPPPCRHDRAVGVIAGPVCCRLLCLALTFDQVTRPRCLNDAESMMPCAAVALRPAASESRASGRLSSYQGAARDTLPTKEFAATWRIPRNKSKRNVCRPSGRDPQTPFHTQRTGPTLTPERSKVQTQTPRALDF